MVDWKSRELHIPNTEIKNGEALHVALKAAAIAALKVVSESRDGMKLATRLGTDVTGLMML